MVDAEADCLLIEGRLGGEKTELQLGEGPLKSAAWDVLMVHLVDLGASLVLATWGAGG